MDATTARLAELGIELPERSTPGANYIPYRREDKLIFITGQLSQWNGERKYIGKLGRDYDVEHGRQAARLAALNVIAHLNAAVEGKLDTIKACVRLAIYVNSDSDFHGQSQVANGASDLMNEVFGDRGKHARMAIGVASLPYNVAAEVEGIFSIKE